MHGPTRIPLYMLSPDSHPARRHVLARPIHLKAAVHAPAMNSHTSGMYPTQAPHRDPAEIHCCSSPSTTAPPNTGIGTSCITILRMIRG